MYIHEYYIIIIIMLYSVRLLYDDVPEFVLFSERWRRWRQRSEHAGMHPRDRRTARFRSLSGIADDAENYAEPIEKRPSAPATAAAVIRGLGSPAISISYTRVTRRPEYTVITQQPWYTITDILCYYYTPSATSAREGGRYNIVLTIWS